MTAVRLFRTVPSARSVPSLSQQCGNRRSLSLNTLRLRNAPVDIHPEIEDALAHNKPIVAQETTLITHGIPYPENMKLSIRMDQIIRETGSIPATIGIIGGRVKIGLKPDELERLANNNTSVAKVSRRDIGAVIASRGDGGTTCSATLIFAHMLGIKIFATGGLGGVHRGGQESMDVSADLHELTRCAVGLVSSGVKSILDIGRTLEYLETLGVPVIAYSKTKDFPAFFSSKSGYQVPWNVNDPLSAAKILHSQWQMGMTNGTLIAAPIPEQHNQNAENIQAAVERALTESEANSITGAAATPWILNRVVELTGGLSLSNNIALLENTALIGGQIAVKYNNLLKNSNEENIPSPPNAQTKLAAATRSDLNAVADRRAAVMVVGAAGLDLISTAEEGINQALGIHSTSPGTCSLALGGVARNMAEACHRVLEAKKSAYTVLLVSATGDDPFGHIIKAKSEAFGMRTGGLTTIKGQRTAVCNMVLDPAGGLIGGVADMGITNALSSDLVLDHIEEHNPSLVAIDANLSTTTISDIVKRCHSTNIPVFFEPTSVLKSANIIHAISDARDQRPIAYTSPNLQELAQMYHIASEVGLISSPEWWTSIDDLSLDSHFRTEINQLARQKSLPGKENTNTGSLGFLVESGVAQQAINLLPFFDHIIIKCGPLGVVLVMRIDTIDSLWRSAKTNIPSRYVVAHGNNSTVVVKHFPPASLGSIINVTGAGDSLVGTILAELAFEPYLFDDPVLLEKAMATAQKNAVLSLESELAVADTIGKYTHI